MNKDKLQQEILEKIKPGMKPSDLKRPKKSIKPLKDEGYSSEEEKIPKAPPLPNQNLQTQITSLKKQLQTYKDFKEADLKIKEKYKQEIAEHKKTITELKSQAKSPGEPQPQKPKEPHLYLFTCDICEQTKKSQLHLGKVNGLGIDPNKENKICSSCLRKVDLIQPPKEDFF